MFIPVEIVHQPRNRSTLVLVESVLPGIVEEAVGDYIPASSLLIVRTTMILDDGNVRVSIRFAGASLLPSAIPPDFMVSITVPVLITDKQAQYDMKDLIEKKLKAEIRPSTVLVSLTFVDGV